MQSARCATLKGKLGNAIRYGLPVAGAASQADGTAERRTSEAMLKRKARRRGGQRHISRPINAARDEAVDKRHPQPINTPRGPKRIVRGTRGQFPL